MHLTGRVSLTSFYARRVRRLLPLSAVVLVVTAIASAAILSPLARPGVLADERASALWFANWHFAAESTSTCQRPSQSPVLHFWSLSVEEQFYVVWPLLIILIAAASRGASWWRLTVRLRTTLLAIFMLSLTASWWLTTSNPTWAYFGLQTRAWELAAGAGLALLLRDIRRVPVAVTGLAGLAGLGLVLWSATHFGPTTAFPGTAALYPVVGAVLLLLSGTARRAGGVSALLATRPLGHVGRVSYGWYLWHWPCLVFAAALAPRAGVGDSATGIEGARSWAVLAAVAVSFALALVSYRLVEEPVRSSRTLVAAPGLTLAFGAALVATSLLIPGHVLAGLGGADAVPDSRAAVQASPRATANGEPLGPATAAAPTPSASLSAGQPVIPRLAVTPLAASRDLWRPKPACMNSFTGTGVAGDCVFGDPAGSKTIVLIGDSHAEAWLPALDAWAKRVHWKVWFWGKSACSVLEPHLLLQGARVYSECQSWQQALNAQLGSLSGVDLVLVVRSRGYLGAVLDDNGKRVRDAAANAVWQRAAGHELALLRGIAPSVVVMRDTPWAGTDVPRCLADHLTRVDQCGFPLSGHAHQDGWMLRAERAGAASLSGVSWIDMTPAVCPQDPCSVVSPSGSIVFRDGHHLTATFSRSLATKLGAALKRHLAT